MIENNHQPTDKSYKFMFKRLGIRLHRYFFEYGDELDFMDTEIPESGKRRDITYKIDGKSIHNVEFQSTPMYDKKLFDMYIYHHSLDCDKNNENCLIKTDVIYTGNPNQGKDRVHIKYNINFQPNIISTKEKDGKKVLSTLIYRLITQEVLSEKEAIDLLILPDGY